MPTATDAPPPPEAKYPQSWSTSGSSSRNSGPIASTLLPLLPTSSSGGEVLELSSGFGHQLAQLAQQAPHLSFQPTEADAYLCTQIDEYIASIPTPNVRKAMQLDLLEQQAWLALFHSLPAPSSRPSCATHAQGEESDSGAYDAVLICNLLHVAPWSVAQAVFAQLDPRVSYLTQRGQTTLLKRDGIVAIYGAFNEDGNYTSQGNRKFDEEIRKRDPAFGLRDVQREIVPLAQQHGFELKKRIEMPAGNLMLIFGLQS